MGRTVGELLDTVDQVELAEWAAFYDLDPWTADRADMNAAMICSVLAHVHGVKAPPSDFMPEYGPPPEPVERSDEDLIGLAQKFNALMGGTVRKT
jgi:hypothetical protein